MMVITTSGGTALRAIAAAIGPAVNLEEGLREKPITLALVLGVAAGMIFSVRASAGMEGLLTKKRKTGASQPAPSEIRTQP
jgi:hypothetical protein